MSDAIAACDVLILELLGVEPGDEARIAWLREHKSLRLATKAKMICRTLSPDAPETRA